MNNITINNQELSIKEWNGQRVVTLADVDSVHERPKGTAKAAFNVLRIILCQIAEEC